MRTLTPRERIAVEALARHVSATVEAGDLQLSLPGRHDAITLIVVDGPLAGAPEKPRLRFDRVVLRLLDGLRTKTSDIVPDGTTAVVTITAPIRLPARTEAAIVERIREGATGDVVDTMQGNGVCIRRVAGLPDDMPKLIGFVHNPETDPNTLLDLAASLLREIPPRDHAGDRWLVVVDDAGRPLVEAYRTICDQLSGAVDAAFLVQAGKVEALVAPKG